MGNSFLHYLRFLLGLDQPSTQTTPAEQALLRAWAKDAKRAVEIGVFEGFNTELLARVIEPGGIVVGIDPFFKGRTGVSWQKKITHTYLKRKGVMGKVQLLEMVSADAIGHIGAPPDFVFIDGDHSWQGIATDWALYSNALRVGGFMGLHDTAAPPHQAWKANMDSVRYFDEHIQHAPNFERVAQADSLNILRKKY
jgi:predicted O-methyltransferase YrrM